MPDTLATHKRWEVISAQVMHVLLYVLLFVAIISGYLISTADGSYIDLFNWVAVPSVTGSVRSIEELVGSLHYWSTWGLVVLAAVHALASIKHHLIDRDNTLRRMLLQNLDRIQPR